MCRVERSCERSGFSRYTIIPDRREAITRAVDLARKGDMILVAGKGHENYQEIKGRKAHFSDAEVLTEALEAKGKQGHG